MLGLWMIAAATAANTSPIEKVLQLMGDLEAKIVADGERAQRIYENFTDYCSDDAKELHFNIETSQKASERHSATIEDAAAEITGLETQIEELGSSIAKNEADLKEATKIRNQEHKDFLAADQDLTETNGMLSRAIAIIEKEMSGGSSLLQTDADFQQRVAAALGALVTAAGVRAEDKIKVQALLQANDDDEQPAGAPAAAEFENQSGGILSTLEDMLEKSQAQQSEGQKAEMTAAHNFAMLKQGLEDAIKNENKELADAKKAKAAAEETKASAEGELEETKKSISEDQQTLKDLQHECMTTAEAYEHEVKERQGELGALAAAKKILQEKTGAAADRAYGLDQQDPSFVQLKMKASLETLKTTDAVATLLQQVSKAAKAKELALLAQRIRATAATAADPFAKVKGMIQEMVEKLIKEAQEEAEHKAFCDEEMSETKAKREDKTDEVDDLKTKIDKFAANVAKLKEDIATTDGELAAIFEAQKKSDELRAAEKEAWGIAKGDFEQGLEGVQMALQVLRDYYAAKEDDAAAALVQESKHTKSSGAAGGIIGMLEVAESDFTTMLAEGQATEDQAQKEHDTVTDDNKKLTAEKQTAVKYMAKDKKYNEALLKDTEEDLGTSQEELDAILEYWEKLQPQCVAKPEPYEERKKRREQEIAGLKQALQILEEESAAEPAFLAVRTA